MGGLLIPGIQKLIKDFFCNLPEALGKLIIFCKTWLMAPYMKGKVLPGRMLFPQISLIERYVIGGQNLYRELIEDIGVKRRVE